MNRELWEEVIKERFGSATNFAKHLGKTRQNVHQVLKAGNASLKTLMGWIDALDKKMPIDDATFRAMLTSDDDDNNESDELEWL